MSSKVMVSYHSLEGVIDRYRRRGISDPKVSALLKKNTRGMVSINVKDVPQYVVRGLLFDKALTVAQRTALTAAAMKDDPLRTPVTDPMQFHIAVTTGLIEKAMLAESKVVVADEDDDDYFDDDEIDERNDGGLGVCAEAELNGRPYPLALKSDYINGFFFSGCRLHATAQVWDIHYQFEWIVSARDFVDVYGKPRAITPFDLLRLKGVRLLDMDLNEFRTIVEKSDELGHKHGTVLSVTGAAIVEEQSWFSRNVQPIKFGSKQFPRKVVVEGEMECDDRNDGESYGVQLPFVRCFDLEQKRYVYVDARDTEGYSFDTKSADNIVLPDTIRGILNKVFEADVSQLFGDVVKGKHGGMVVLAHGEPGVGKTMTAETFAELAHRPLYSMDIGELGIRLESIEDNLQKIFKRATRWNAVLLLDEADIFMAHRDSTSIERSAIVGIFLRLLDYFPGMLFLTTNRANQIDPAFLSRVTLKLNYPGLDDKARVKIWRMLLQAGELHVQTDSEAMFESELGTIKVNGRQIKNIVRLLKVLYPSNVVTLDQIKEVAQFSEDRGITRI